MGKISDYGAQTINLIEQFKNDSKELDMITDAIKQNHDNTEKLKKYQESIYNNLAPMINHKMEDEINDLKGGLSTESKVALDVTNWRVQQKLEDAKLQISEMTNGFASAKNFTKSIDKLMKAVDTLIHVYNLIQNYQKEEKNDNYLAAVSSVQANKLSITDPTVGKAINELEILIRSNSIIYKYGLILDAFKQLTFPFAHLYLKQTQVPDSLILTDILEIKVNEVIDQIESMITNTQKYKNSNTIRKHRISHAEFSSNGDSTEPFFVWKNEHYKSKISDLLDGNEILLTADIQNSKIQEDAVKFRELAVNLKAKSNSVQLKINELLKSFRINMVPGNRSQYRFYDKIYNLPDQIYTIEYSFEANPYGEPISASQDYYSIKNGDYVLSSFNDWKLKLINKLPNKRNISFDDLKQYKNEIDLELVGKASFIEKNTVGEDSEFLTQLDKYYGKPEAAAGEIPFENYETYFKSLLSKSIQGIFDPSE